MHTDEPKVIRIEATKEGEVTAGDIITDADIEILNPELHLATVDASGSLKMELTVERGRGYVPADKNKKPDHVIGVIPIDFVVRVSTTRWWVEFPPSIKHNTPLACLSSLTYGERIEKKNPSRERTITRNR